MNAFPKWFACVAVATNQSYNACKIPEQVVTLFYMVLFRMHKRDTAKEEKFGFAMQMVLEHVLPASSKQSAKWIAKVTNIKKHAKNTKIPGNSSGVMF